MTKPRILVIEPDASAASDLGARIGAIGYEVAATASTGEDAVALAGDLQPDLVLLDVGLRGALGGIEAAQQIRHRLRLPVVFLSTRPESEAVGRAKVAEPFGYVFAPFDDTKLRIIIEAALYKHRAEEAIQESEASLALAQRIAHLGSWELNLAQGSLTWSDEIFRIFGLSRDTFVPSSEAFYGLVHPADRERVRAAALAAVRTREPYVIDHRILLPDGRERVVNECAEVFVDAQGTPVRMVGTVQDITRLREMELALQRSERYFRSLIENAQDLITILDDQGMIRFQSPSVHRALGYTPAEFVNRRVIELVHPEDVPLVEAAIARALRSPEVASTTEFRLRHADGSWRIVESIGSRLRGEEPPAVVVNSRDITDRRRLEEQFRQSQKMEAIGQLAGGVAHDFNNILTVIQGSGSLLLETPNRSKEDAELVRQILDAAERAARLTRQLLLFSRKQVWQPVNLDLNEVVGNMTKMLQRILGEDISLRADYGPNLPLVRADAGMLEQLLLNLAVNSRDAMPDGGRLVITTAKETLSEDVLKQHPDAPAGPCVCVSVSDTGCGITSENLPHIFEPFFTTKDVGKGTGLGLATTYGIVKQHGGCIEVVSEIGKGTTFRFCLPVAEGSRAEPQAAPETLEPRAGGGTILVVEDEPALRRLVHNLLERRGYTPLLAESGVAALAVWKAHQDEIQLLLTDMVMPDGMTGRELAERLRADRPDLKVVYTSGYSADVLGKDPPLVEGVNFLQKPYAPRKLAEILRNYLDRD